MSVGQQLKPEQCDERSAPQRQSEPLVFEGADHTGSAVAPIKPDFSQKPTSADPLSPNRCHHQDAGTVLQTREIASVMAAACKALEGAMNIEATALGVADLLEDQSI